MSSNYKSVVDLYMIKLTNNVQIKKKKVSKVPPASSTTTASRHDIAEILLKVALKHQKPFQNQIKSKVP